MKGLIYKDLRLLRGTLLIYIPLIILLYLFTPDSTFAGSFSSVLLVILPTSCFAVDEVCGWDKYAATLPVGRKTVVGARYVLMLLLLAGITALVALASLLPRCTQSLEEMLLPVVSVLLFTMMELPLLYHFGRKVWTYLVSCLIAFPLSFLFLLPLSGMPGLVLVLLAVGFWISYKVSCSIVAKSEY